jgi:hypothetical protein
MVDIYCPRCGEPWDVYSLVEDMTPEEAADLKAGRGCPCCKGKPVESRPFRAEASGVLLEVLGDDIDGVAATLEDFGL